MSEAKIILSTLNAKYVHSSLGLRYLFANMQTLKPQTDILEFSINGQINLIAEQILAQQPTIVGFGVYIWNVEETLRLVRLLKTLKPELVLILGGPEVSYETETQEIIRWVDYVICGQADLQFAQLCQAIISGNRPDEKILQASVPNLAHIKPPYEFYTEEDIKNRLIYVEASRGCPFKCEFCLSALDKTAYPFDSDLFLEQIERLYNRGARSFKFVDRTFNLKVKESLKILQFFLQRIDSDLFLHFEIIPDRLPEALKETIQKFPKGCLQFEIGIQTFNPQVQTLISRKQDNQQSIQNLNWLKQKTSAHLHTDLIFGLPGEDMQSFAAGFNQLVGLDPDDIQVGILKRLKGTPIIRYSKSHCLKFNPNPPFEIVATQCVDFNDIRAMSRFARYWEMIGNSGHFKSSLKILLAEDPFYRFSTFCQWLFKSTGQTHKISLRRLYDLIFYGATEMGIEPKDMWPSLWQDYQQAGLKGRPEFMKKENIEVAH